MTDTMTHSSKIPHFSKRHLLRKGVLNSLLVSALGLYVATTPPTFGAVGGIAGGSSAGDSENTSAPAAHASAIEISDTEKAGWLRWIWNLGRSRAMDAAPKSTPDLNSFRDDSVEGWDDFLAQHGAALLAREPYYQAGGAPETLLKTLQNIQKIAFLVVKDRINYDLLKKTSYSVQEYKDRHRSFIRESIDNWGSDSGTWISTKEKIVNFLEFGEMHELFYLHGFDAKGLRFLRDHGKSLPLDEPGAGQKREGFTAAIDPFLALLYATIENFYPEKSVGVIGRRVRVGLSLGE